MIFSKNLILDYMRLDEVSVGTFFCASQGKPPVGGRKWKGTRRGNQWYLTLNGYSVLTKVSVCWSRVQGMYFWSDLAPRCHGRKDNRGMLVSHG